MSMHTYIDIRTAGKNEIALILNFYGAQTNTKVTEIIKTLSGMFEVLNIKEQTILPIYIKKYLVCVILNIRLSLKTNPTIFNFITFL